MIKKTKKHFSINLSYILLIVFVFFSFNINFSSFVSYAEDFSNYSFVLEDLESDKKFNKEDYVVDNKDYSIQVIQIAENKRNELIIYTYQPCIERNLIASSINISKKINDELNFMNYKLELVNYESMFYKYVVKDLILDATPSRYYHISSIFRPFNDEIDSQPENGNTISELSYPVGQLWTAFNYEGDILYSREDIELISITEKYVGFVRFEDGYSGNPGFGLSWHKPGCDGHFIAFNTNRKIDKLMEADVFYTKQEYSYVQNIIMGESESFGEKIDSYTQLEYTDRFQITVPHGFIKYSYSWDRIQTVEEFIENENREYLYSFGSFNVSLDKKLTDDGVEDIKNMQWVLRFAETEYSNYYTTIDHTDLISKTHHIRKTIISNVSILRLKFESDGLVYNVGVVDNKLTGDGIPDNETILDIKPGWWSRWWVELIIFLIIVVLVLIFMPSLIVYIIKFVFFLLYWIFRFIWFILKSPFVLIKKIISKRR